MTARERALKALYDTEKNGTYTNAALSAALSAENITAEDKGFITEIIYGVVSNKTALDYIISRYSKLKLKKISPWVLCILRMGIFQMYYMDKIPHSAACNEAVKLAKKYSHGAGAGFVNGVLRSFSRDADSFEFPKTDNEIYDLSLEYSYPEWITKSISDEYGIDRCRELYIENAKAHGAAIRVNTLKTDTKKCAERLKSEGIETRQAEKIPNCLIVEFGKGLTNTAAYRDGLFSIQNISSQLAVAALDPKAGETVIDMCSAPGGKACAAAERMENRGRIKAFDIFEHKIRLIENSAKRLGIDIIDCEVGNSAEPNKDLYGIADRVLADVPCSGLGVIHKKPDIKWHRKESDIAELAAMQKKILENAALYVKKGGVLVYSTCTILNAENGAQTERFLSEHSEFTKIYEEQILTGSLGESGFYICKMQKNN